MARPKKQVKLKEPIKIRLKPLADGNKSIYLTSVRDNNLSLKAL